MVRCVSLLPPHIYAKKISLGVQGNSKKCVCLCACASPQQSQITFDILVGWQPNFQGLLNFSQVIFGLVTRTRGPQGGPRKWGFPPNLSTPGVLAQGGGVTPLRNWDDDPNKMLGAEFWVLAHGRRKRGRKAGLAGGPTKILEFQHFL